MIRACSLCQFYVPLGSIATRGSCVRFPTPMMKNDGDWCGEFAASVSVQMADSAAAESKPARRRRLKEAAPPEAAQ